MKSPSKIAATQADKLLAMEIESAWRARLKHEDSGSDWEKPSRNYNHIVNIVDAARALTDALLEYERVGDD